MVQLRQNHCVEGRVEFFESLWLTVGRPRLNEELIVGFLRYRQVRCEQNDGGGE